MAKYSGKYEKKLGQPPGTLIYTGQLEAPPQVKMEYIRYNADELSKTESLDIKTLLDDIKTGYTNWINIPKLGNVNIIDDAGKYFGFHPLLLEDILNTEHLPKWESFPEHIFVTMKSVSVNINGELIHKDPIRFVLGPNYVLSFHDSEEYPFFAIRERLSNKYGKLRERGNDYLFYCLLDQTIDQYYHAMAKLEEQTETLEDAIAKNDPEFDMGDILRLRNEIFGFKRYVFALYEEFRRVSKEETHLISKRNQMFFDDLIDHLKQINDSLEGYREVVIGLMELHHANITSRINGVMRNLTVIATIFIPLTFIVGIYGMNFKFMPEINKKWTYPALMIFMFVLGIGMYLRMKAKKWF
jgi:magnesium transporter